MKKTTAARNDDLAARVKALTDKLESGVKDVFESDAYKSYLTAMSKLHRYSFGNVLLILWQCPEASVVAGFGKLLGKVENILLVGLHTLVLFL